ncbi:ABC transporter permease [Demequina sediminicola]|uniref:ABC transporter permease n=1 Tax=Demequina sediminicola TaxID=1095026 RepID=UPI00078197EA|nr:ABC transporter permease subunit [Demequina sediminicola]
MSTVTTEPGAVAPAHAPVSPPPRRGNPWAPTWHGVGLMARIELRRRRPTVKGYVFYGLTFAVTIGICILAAVMDTSELTSVPLELALILVMGVGALIAPSLSATSVNGDSTEGVLAPLQMSHLTAGDIAVGKLLASWCVAVIALLALSPFLVYAFLKSGWHLDELLVTIAAVLLVVLALTAVGLAWSSLAARAVASVALAHLTTGVLLIGTLVLYGVASIAVTDTVTYTDRYIDWEQLSEEEAQALDAAYVSGDYSSLDPADYTCTEHEYTSGVAHTERVAWILLLNPAVMVAETAPVVDPETYIRDGRAAPGLFSGIHTAVSGARVGPFEDDLGNVTQWDECAEIFGTGDGAGAGEEADAQTAEELEAEWALEEQDWQEYERAVATTAPAPWPGVAVCVVLLFGSMALVIQRLRVPYKKLRKGTRVA